MRIFMLSQTSMMDLDRMTELPSVVQLTDEIGRGKAKKIEPVGWVLQVPQHGGVPVYVRSAKAPDELPTDLYAIIERIVRATWNGVEEAIVPMIPLPAQIGAIRPGEEDTIQ